MLCFWFLAFVVLLPPENFLFDASRFYCWFPAPFLLMASVLFLLPGTFFVDGICFLLRVGLHIVRCLSVVFHSGSKHFGVRLPACLAMPAEKKLTAKAKAAKVLVEAEAVEHSAAESANGDCTAATAAPQASVAETSAPDDKLFEEDEAAPAVAKAGSTPATAAPAASQAEPKALSAAPVAATAGPTATATAGPKADAAAPDRRAHRPAGPASATPKAGGHASAIAEPTVGSPLSKYVLLRLPHHRRPNPKPWLRLPKPRMMPQAVVRLRWRRRAAMHPRLRSRRWAVQLSILTYR